MISDRGRLVVQLGGRTWTILPLNRPVLTIGREPGNDLTLPDSRVSRRHAEIRLEATGPTLTDLGSSNGTFEGDTQLFPHQPHLLTSGIPFTIGLYTLIYQAPSQSPHGDAGSSRPEQAPESVRSAPTSVPVLPPTPPMPARTVDRMSRAPGPHSEYLRNLPAIFQENDFLSRYLLIFETLWEPLERRQDHLDMYFDPRTCPAPFLPWLASWFGLSTHAHWPEGRLRERLAEAMDLYRWRGTRYGLARMLEVSTGVTPQIAEEPSEPCVFRITMRVPKDFEVHRDIIEQLIESHKPAHAGYILDLQQ